MKKKILQMSKIASAIALAAVFFFLFGNDGMQDVQAGTSEIVVDNRSFAETLDTSLWNAPNEDVSIENATLVFGEDSTEDTRLITKRAVAPCEYFDELFYSDYTMKIKKLPQGKQFIVALGLKTIESYSGEAGNLELVFANQGGLKVSLKYYDEDEEEVVLSNMKSFGGSMGKDFSISIKAMKDGQLAIKVNQVTLYNGKSPVDLEKRMGFLQTGGCVVQVSKVKITSFMYDRPENANIVEDFERGTMNVNVLGSKMFSRMQLAPAGIRVEDYNGSKVLMFRNASTGYIGTKYKYSNFELSFDVPFMLNYTEINENGGILRKANRAFIISYGEEMREASNYGYSSAPDAIQCNNSALYRLTGEKQRFSFETQDGVNKYFSLKENEGYSLKLRVEDYKVTLYVKALEAKEYDVALSYELGTTTPMGYVNIWCVGQNNFAIDNLKITNLDKDPKLLDLEYKEGFLTGTEDWEYKETKAEYRKVAEEKQGINWYVVFAAELGVAVVVLCTCIIISKTRKKRKTEEVRE